MKTPLFAILTAVHLIVIAYAFGHFMGRSECRSTLHSTSQRLESLSVEWERAAAAADRAGAPDAADALRECAWKIRQP